MSNELYSVNLGGKRMLFGSYPQSLVTDENVLRKLSRSPFCKNKNSGIDYEYLKSLVEDERLLRKLPRSLVCKDKERIGVDYGYPMGWHRHLNYMRYMDEELDGEKYRGVYFDMYRPSVAGGESVEFNTLFNRLENSGKSFQPDNGFYSGEVYWFKWEPIEWRILKKDAGNAFLFSNVVLDGMHFSLGDAGYLISDLRIWLNDYFFNTAFNARERAVVKTTNVDNSLASSLQIRGISGEETTRDKVFLLSAKEATDINFGFTSTSSKTTSRELFATPYSQAQGIGRIYHDGYFAEKGLWWLRSFDNVGNAFYVDHSGQLGCRGGGSVLGIAPAINISL